jgi:hypothetical protein
MRPTIDRPDGGLEGAGRRKMEPYVKDSAIATRVRELETEGEKWWTVQSVHELGAAVLRLPYGTSLKDVRHLTGGDEYRMTALKNMGEAALLVAAQKIMGAWWGGIPPEARAWLVARLGGRKELITEDLLRICGCDFREADAAVLQQEEDLKKTEAVLDEEKAKIEGTYGEEVAHVLLRYSDAKLEEGEVRDLVGGDKGAQLRAAHAAAVRLGEMGVRSLGLLEALSSLNPNGVVRGPMVDMIGASAAQSILERNVRTLEDAGITPPQVDAALIKAAAARL